MIPKDLCFFKVIVTEITLATRERGGRTLLIKSFSMHMFTPLNSLLSVFRPGVYLPEEVDLRGKVTEILLYFGQNCSII